MNLLSIPLPFPSLPTQLNLILINLPSYEAEKYINKYWHTGKPIITYIRIKEATKAVGNQIVQKHFT